VAEIIVPGPNAYSESSPGKYGRTTCSQLSDIGPKRTSRSDGSCSGRMAGKSEIISGLFPVWGSSARNSRAFSD
jgi:hypothetical protein